MKNDVTFLYCKEKPMFTLPEAPLDEGDEILDVLPGP
jgi:hypothetical protein